MEQIIIENEEVILEEVIQKVSTVPNEDEFDEFNWYNEQRI